MNHSITHEEFKQLLFPVPSHVEPCPVCGSAAELWQRSDSPSAPTYKVVMCSHGEKLGMQDGMVNEGCLLYMPPEDFYRNMIRDAIKYWNALAIALKQLRNERIST